MRDVAFEKWLNELKEKYTDINWDLMYDSIINDLYEAYKIRHKEDIIEKQLKVDEFA